MSYMRCEAAGCGELFDTDDCPEGFEPKTERWLCAGCLRDFLDSEAEWQCSSCHDTGHVCENCPDRPWAGICADDVACDCGAGMPCPDCTAPTPQDGTHSISDCFVPRAAKH